MTLYKIFASKKGTDLLTTNETVVMYSIDVVTMRAQLNMPSEAMVKRRAKKSMLGPTHAHPTPSPHSIVYGLKDGKVYEIVL